MKPNRPPLKAVYFIEVVDIVKNIDDSWTLTYYTIGEDKLHVTQFPSGFTFPSGETLDILLPNVTYVIRYQIHNNKLTYEKAYEVEILGDIE